VFNARGQVSMRRRSARCPGRSDSAERTGRLVHCVRTEVSLHRAAGVRERDPLLSRRL